LSIGILKGHVEQLKRLFRLFCFPEQFGIKVHIPKIPPHGGRGQAVSVKHLVEEPVGVLPVAGFLEILAGVKESFHRAVP